MKKTTKRPSALIAKSKVREVVRGSAFKVSAAIDEVALRGDLSNLVPSARQRIATAAYYTQTLLCWHMGRRLDREHLQGGCAPPSRQMLVTVSRVWAPHQGLGLNSAEMARGPDGHEVGLTAGQA